MDFYISRYIWQEQGLFSGVFKGPLAEVVMEATLSRRASKEFIHLGARTIIDFEKLTSLAINIGTIPIDGYSTLPHSDLFFHTAIRCCHRIRLPCYSDRALPIEKKPGMSGKTELFTRSMWTRNNRQNSVGSDTSRYFNSDAISTTLFGCLLAQT